MNIYIYIYIYILVVFFSNSWNERKKMVCGGENFLWVLQCVKQKKIFKINIFRSTEK